jgi:hypothetical protein
MERMAATAAMRNRMAVTGFMVFDKRIIKIQKSDP